MSSRARHYRGAERPLAMKARVLTLWEVQVHAMLATVHDDADSEYVNFMSMEERRERVGRGA
jgi:hypothetical protein